MIEDGEGLLILGPVRDGRFWGRQEVPARRLNRRGVTKSDGAPPLQYMYESVRMVEGLQPSGSALWESAAMATHDIWRAAVDVRLLGTKWWRKWP
jgi:hypothetical protein